MKITMKAQIEKRKKKVIFNSKNNLVRGQTAYLRSLKLPRMNNLYRITLKVSTFYRYKGHEYLCKDQQKGWI